MTVKAWGDAVRASACLSDSLAVIERANAAGADFAALVELQDAAVERERVQRARSAELLDRFGNDGVEDES